MNEIFIPFLNDIYQNINLSIQVLYQKKSYQKLSHNLQKKKEKFLISFSSHIKTNSLISHRRSRIFWLPVTVELLTLFRQSFQVYTIFSSLVLNTYSSVHSHGNYRSLNFITSVNPVPATDPSNSRGILNIGEPGKAVSTSCPTWQSEGRRRAGDFDRTQIGE